MKRIVIGFSAFVVLVGVLIAAPKIIGDEAPSDHGRKATGPLWQGFGGSKSDIPQGRQSEQAPGKGAADAQAGSSDRPAGAPSGVPGTIDKRNAEIQELSKMYAEKGATPELMRRIAKLRAAQGGKAGASPISPDMMARLMKQRAAMQAGQRPPIPGKRPIGVTTQFPSLMDPRFSPVMGRIVSREKVSLTPDAVLSVRVLDITKSDAPPRIIAEQAFVNPGQMPVSFQVWYNKQNVNTKRRYAVQAVVADKGAVRWKSTAECKSIAKAEPANLEIPLQPFKTPAPPAPGMLVGDTPVTFADGHKPFMADDNWMVPVAPVMQAAGAELDYSESSKELTVQVGDSSFRAKLPGRTVVLKDGSKRDLTAALTIRDGAVYAPIQFLQMATSRKALFDRESNTFVLVRM